MTHRGMGSVYQPSYTEKLPDGTKVTKTAATWAITYNQHGKRIRESAHSANRAVAVSLLKQRITDMGSGRPVGPRLDRTTLDDMRQMLEAEYSANGRRSLDRAKQGWAHLSSFFSADCKARDISGDRLTRYQAQRLEEGAKPSTVNYELALLRRAFHLAARAGKVALRPEFTLLAVSNTRKGFFEAAQFRSVLAHLPEYLRGVAATAYITGWRTKSELITRQWRHVDLVNGWLKLEPGEGKTQQPRLFPFTPELRSVIEAQREHVRELERATGQITPWVFVHSDGSRIKDFRFAWAKACRAAGVPGHLVHDLRRTAVRNLERAGVPRSAAMSMTGHKTEAVYRRYAIVDSSMLRDAAVKLGALHATDANGPRTVQVEALRAKDDERALQKRPTFRYF